VYAARLLVSLSASVRPPSLLGMPRLVELAGQTNELALALARAQPHGQAAYLLYTAVSNALLLVHPTLQQRRGDDEMAAAVQPSAPWPARARQGS
jgi:hypothetical protein